MARKERNNVDYFPHSVTHGKKMFYLRTKFKNDGYAVWFMLLEELGKADHHYLDLKDDIQLMYLSSSFMVSEIVLKEIIETLVKFNEFDSELWEKESILFNKKFIENISDAYKKRNNNCIDKISLVELLTAKGRIKLNKSTPKRGKRRSKGDGNTQRIVKDTKEDDIKVNKIPAYEDFKTYALEKKQDVNLESLKLKYESWVENGWKNGNNKEIKNWKATLLNTLPYIKENFAAKKTPYKIDPNIANDPNRMKF